MTFKVKAFFGIMSSQISYIFFNGQKIPNAGMLIGFGWNFGCHLDFYEIFARRTHFCKISIPILLLQCSQRIDSIKIINN